MDTLASLGCDQIWFSDDIFGLKPQWLQQFRDSMRERGPILPYRCLSRADILARGDSVDVLAESGCVEVWMGAESGSQSVLDAMDKDQTIDDVLTSCKRLRKAGIRVGLFLQLGYPGETLGDVRQTFAMVRRVRPDEVGISVSYPLPGTPFYERVKSEMESTHSETAMDNAILFQATYPQGFYQAARGVLRGEHAIVRGLRAAQRLALQRRGPKGRRGEIRRIGGAMKHLSKLPYHYAALQWHARQPSDASTVTP